MKLLWLLQAAPSPGPALSPWCAPWSCPPPTQWGSGATPCTFPLRKQQSYFLRLPGGGPFAFLFSQPEAILQHVGTLVLPEPVLLTLGP